MERHDFDWSSANVEPIGDFYELWVQLASGSPTGTWSDCFNEEATRHYRETRSEPWGAIVTTGDTILVQDLEPGAEDALEARLRALVDVGNRCANEKTRRPEERGTPAGNGANARGRIAAAMAERLRGRR